MSSATVDKMYPLLGIQMVKKYPEQLLDQYFIFK
jgi:hypothetical protein